jgi:hypothetical protein
VSEGAVERFERSMAIDHEKWHDGIGYDLEAIDAATPQERARIEALVLGRGARDWRDVEALARLDTPGTREALRGALARGSHEIRMAIARHAPALTSDAERSDLLVAALKGADFYGGLSQALDQAAAFHPPAVLDALFRGLLERSGEVAVHFAALLAYLHDAASEPFDMEQRPFFLRFATPDRAAREAAFRDLCVRIGVDPARWLGA